ncbi:hypothetical protein E2562_023886 [Oryza meyeriana var. granulata]|uniref:Uncharacterized protein n=1 Tax=Oryza meyeriana var. granulata TaxID=110450 RepID=A0A6G1D6A1_9ORYZ|nr:hypothetical protein E2562_023886 [Oryza meyeriana var. granulata]
MPDSKETHTSCSRRPRARLGEVLHREKLSTRRSKACSQAGSFLDVDWLTPDDRSELHCYSRGAAPKAQAHSHAGSSTRGRLAGRSSGQALLASSSARSEWGRRSRRAECVPPFCELRGGVAHGDSTVAGKHTDGTEPGGQGWWR